MLLVCPYVPLIVISFSEQRSQQDLSLTLVHMNRRHGLITNVCHDEGATLQIVLAHTNRAQNAKHP